MTQIAAVRSAYPQHRYAQAEITDMVADLSGLGRAQRSLVDRLHGNSGVKFRHLVFPIEEYRVLIPRLGLRPVIKRLRVFGLGCVAGAAALARLHDYLLAWPGHTAPWP